MSDDLSVDLLRTDGTAYDSTNSSHVPHLMHVDMLHEAIAYVADTGANRVLEVYYRSGFMNRTTRDDYPIHSSTAASFVYDIRENVSWKVVGRADGVTHVALHAACLYALGEGRLVTAFDTTSPSFRVLGTFAVQGARGLRTFDGLLFVVTNTAVLVHDASSSADAVVACEGRCGTWRVGESCPSNDECQTLNCREQTCAPRVPVAYNRTNNLRAYIGSDVYNRSFVNRHILTDGFSSYASYLNLYPIMEDDFCQTVGNATGTPDCDLIDFDSLLLGNCGGHPCLPNHLHCRNNGTLQYASPLGYRCLCDRSHHGDVCQHVVSGLPFARRK